MSDSGDNLLLKVHKLATTIAEGRRVEISLELRRGELVQLSGPSGCGKTTALRMLARLTAAEQGEMDLRGRPFREIKAPAWRRQIAYLAQQPVMLDGTVRDNLLAAYATSRATRAVPRDSGRAGRLLDSLGLDAGELMEQDARVLSGGEAARVALARVLMMRPAVLLADEPTAALDPDNAAALVRAVSRWTEQGGAVVLVAHDPIPWEGVERRVLDMGTGEAQERGGAPVTRHTHAHEHGRGQGREHEHSHREDR